MIKNEKRNPRASHTVQGRTLDHIFCSVWEEGCLKVWGLKTIPLPWRDHCLLGFRLTEVTRFWKGRGSVKISRPCSLTDLTGFQIASGDFPADVVSACISAPLTSGMKKWLK